MVAHVSPDKMISRLSTKPKRAGRDKPLQTLCMQNQAIEEEQTKVKRRNTGIGIQSVGARANPGSKKLMLLGDFLTRPSYKLVLAVVLLLPPSCPICSSERVLVHAHRNRFC